jgi:hypothetical protein
MTEAVTLWIKLHDDAGAGVDNLRKKVERLSPAGRAAALGLNLAAKAAENLGSLAEKGAGKAVAEMDKLIAKAASLAKWTAVAAAGFASWELKGAIRMHAEMDAFEISIRRVTGSASKAREMVNLVLAETRAGHAPEEFEEAIQRLTGMGADPNKWLRPLHDLAVGTHKELGEVIAEFKTFYLGGFDANAPESAMALRRLGLDAAAMGLSGKDRAADREKFLAGIPAGIQAQFGGLSDQVNASLGGLFAGITGKLHVLAYEATGALVDHMEADLRKIDTLLGGAKASALANSLGKQIAAVYDVVSQKAQGYMSTGQAQGWKAAFAALWKDIEPEITKAAVWLGTTFAKAFINAVMAILSGTANGDMLATALAGYGFLKLGGGKLIGHEAKAAAAALRGRAEAIGAVEVVRDSSAVAAGRSYLMRGLAYAGGGSAATGAAALALLVGGASGLYSHYEQGKYGVEAANDPISRVGKWMGNNYARQRLGWSGARDTQVEAQAASLFDESQARIAAKEIKAIAEILDGIKGQVASLTASQGTISRLISTSGSAFGKDYAETLATGDTPEERLKVILGDILSANREIAAVDYSKVAAGKDLVDLATKHLGLLDAQWDRTKQLAAEMDVIRAKQLSHVDSLVSMGPAEYAQRQSVVKALSGASDRDLAAALQSGQLGDLQKRYGFMSDMSEAWKERLGRGAGMEIGAPGSSVYAGEKARQEAERGRAQAETSKRTADAVAIFQADIKKIEVTLNYGGRDELINSVTLMIKQTEGEIKEALADALKAYTDEIKRNSTS